MLCDERWCPAFTSIPCLQNSSCGRHHLRSGPSCWTLSVLRRSDVHTKYLNRHATFTLLNITDKARAVLRTAEELNTEYGYVLWYSVRNSTNYPPQGGRQAPVWPNTLIPWPLYGVLRATLHRSAVYGYDYSATEPGTARWGGGL